MKKHLVIASVALFVLAITVGFLAEDPFGSKTSNSNTQQNVNPVPYVSPNGTPIYTDNFDGANDTAALRARGYKFYQQSVPVGTTNWFQGNSTVFTAYNGPSTGYVGANYNATSGVGTIDLWLVLPFQVGGYQAGDSVYFYHRSPDASTYPDSMRVMYSAADSTPAGTWTELGRFKTSTAGWALAKYRIATTSATGRVAIRYAVANGGPSGANSDYIGIDALSIVRTSAPPVWSEQSSGLTSVLYSVNAPNDDVAWVCGAAGKVLRTTNKGATWTNVSGTIPTTYALYNIYAWDANSAVVTGVAGSTTAIYATSNGGSTWTLGNSHAGFGDNLYMTSASNAYFIGDPVSGNWDLLKSTNGGFNWSSWATLPTTNTSGTYNNAACFLGNQVWFESVGLSTIHYSTDLGTTWTSQSISLSELTAIWFNSTTRGLAGGSSTTPGLLTTTNAGVNWSAITSPYPTSSISGIVGTGTTWWISQQGTGISISTNDGANWSTAYTAAAGNFYHMTMARTGSTIWGVRSNGGISRYGTPLTAITPISTVTPENYKLGQNYPNPFNPVTKINFAIPKSGLVSIKVYDVLGKEVQTLVNEVKTAGSYAVDFNGSNLASGIYFYKISVDGFTDVKKMTLVK